VSDARAGWGLPMVRNMLGHASISTASVYSHVVVDDEIPPDPFAFAGGSPVPNPEQGGKPAEGGAA